MTVSSQDSDVTYEAGPATVFSLPFRFFNNSEIFASLVDIATGDLAALTYGIDYTLSGAGEPEVDGNAVSQLYLSQPIPGGKRLYVERTLPEEQQADIINQGKFFPEIHENVFDRLVMLIQQVSRGLSNTISRSPIGLWWDALGWRIRNVGDPIDSGDAVNLESMQQYVTDQISGAGGAVPATIYFTPDGVTTTFSLPGITIGDPAAYTVTLDGIDQRPGLDYNIDLPGQSIVFTTAPPSNPTGTPIIGMVRVLGFTRQIARGVVYVNNVAALRLLLKTQEQQFAETGGYYARGDGGDGRYWLDLADTTSADNGGTIIVANDGGRWKLLTLATPKRFGARADSNLAGGGTDDTAAINAFIASYGNGRKHLEFDPGAAYNITSLTLSGIDYSIDFKDCTFYGRATTPTDALMTLQNFSAHNIANFHLRTDGNAVTPVYHGNYQCALRMITTAPGNPATQFLRINSLKIWYFRQGIVNGNHFGASSQPSFTQSEIWIDDYQVRGVNRPYVGNLINSYVVFTNSGFIPQKFEASASWWVDADGFCAANVDARSMVLFQNCEFQRAIQSGYALYGNEINVIEPVWEVSCPCYVAGNLTIVGGIDGYFGASAIVPFQVQPTAVGKLHLERFNLHRPAGTADFDRSLLVDCTGNVNFRVWLTNCRLGEWAFNSTLGSGDLVRDGRLHILNTWIDNSTGTAPSFELNQDLQVIQNVDRTGDTMVTSSTTTTGGWTVYTGAANGAFGSNVTSPPLNFAKMILMTTSASGSFGIATPTANGSRIPMQANRDYLFETWIRVGGSVPAGSTIVFQIDWYDFAGTLGNTSTLFSLDSATFAPFTSNRRVRGAVTAPANAASAVIRVAIGPNITVRFCDITLT